MVVIHNSHNSDNIKEKPLCLFQPVNRERKTSGLRFPSKTFSRESRDIHAYRKSNQLIEFHKHYVEPDYFLTIDYKEPLSIEQVKAIKTARSRAVIYFNGSREAHIAGYYAYEVSPGNVLHEHILIRTDLKLGEVKAFFDKHLAKVNRKYQTSVALTYLEPVEDSAACSKYMHKAMQGEQPLLFKPHLGMHLEGDFGNYFLGVHRKELKALAQESFELSLYESKLEAALPEAEQQLHSSKPEKKDSLLHTYFHAERLEKAAEGEPEAIQGDTAFARESFLRHYIICRGP